MTVNRSLALLVIAIVCFAVLLILALGWVTGGNQEAWLAGGLLAAAASRLPGRKG